MTSTEIVYSALHLAAQVGRHLQQTRAAGKRNEGLVVLITMARIIDADLSAMVAQWPDKELMKALEREIRGEMERIYTHDWVRQ